MNNSANKFLLGLGIVLILCGAYWIYRGGELLEIVLPIILGIGAITWTYSGRTKNNNEKN